MIWVTLMGLLSIYRIYWSEPFGLRGSQPWEVRFSRAVRYWVKVMCLLCLASSRVRPIDSLKTGMVRWKLITISHCIHHPPSDVLNCTENKYTETYVKDRGLHSHPRSMERVHPRCRPEGSAAGPTPLSLRGPDCWLSNSQLVNEETRYYITN